MADLTPAEAIAATDWPDRGTIGVAVSGGSDSLALLCLLIDRLGPERVRAVTVDHGLRPEAAAEAKTVARIAADLGVAHDTIHWRGWDGTGNTQSEARRARYALMADWARQHGLSTIALGHTADDLAETLLMRLGREAGVDGLAGMADQRMAHGITWRRPLLPVRRDALRVELRARSIDWVDDPSNADDSFDRVRLRKAMRDLDKFGLSVEGLAHVAQQLGDARDALAQVTHTFARTAVTLQAGDVLIDRDALSRQPFDIRRRLLSHALRWVSSAEYAPRRQPLLHLLAAIETGKDATLHGCHILVARQQARICREWAAVKDIAAQPTEIWDKRWSLGGPDQRKNFEIRALGETGLNACPDWRALGLPRAALISTPAIWQEDVLLAAPLAGFANGWEATLCSGKDDFFASILSR